MRKINYIKWILFCAFLCTEIISQAQEISISPLFGDGMVLQRDKSIPVFGKTDPNAKISITFRSQTATALADSEGKWQVNLKPEVYGGPDELIIKTESMQLVFNDVYVGEVWICSGQSNMEMPMLSNWAHVNNAEKEVAEANDSNIHLFVVERNTSFHPLQEMTSTGWKVCTSQAVADFSAVAYFFGRNLSNSLNMPIGLIQTAWGGTVAEAWTSGETLKTLADFKESAIAIEKLPTDKKELEKKYQKDLEALFIETAQLDKGIEGKDTLYSVLDLDDSDWMEMNLPGMIESTKIGSVDGAIWFRKTLEVTKENAQKINSLHIAAPDDSDETWLNGVKVGESAEWDVPRIYSLPKGLVKAGKNTIAVRLTDWRGAGGFMGEASHFALTSEDGVRIELANQWKVKVGYDMRDVKTRPVQPNEPNQPSVLYNAMINPLIPYAFKGVIWYQGESNVGRAEQYKELFPAMISDWRTQWGADEFPFLFVQLATYLKRNEQPVEDSWSELREAQRNTLQLKNTGMAVAVDIGDADNIHPGNKQDVGKRLALWARNKVYAENIPYCGPSYKSMQLKESSLVVEFDHCYQGLKTSDQREVTGFAIAGKDGVYHWAKAKIDGNNIVLSSDQVIQPVFVRYAWSSNPDCNLINSAELPASPFQANL
ncbi:sialate O-acetylesterase [Labilibaculum filiforme]|uniref:sialate O-acetylesterase n=1 Tax=Labilibaculum filiforme TaxID=1940526 RepID=UPI000C6E36CC|nr:sialate O-acetylesterase [Labilibaculum filiforme]